MDMNTTTRSSDDPVFIDRIGHKVRTLTAVKPAIVRLMEWQIDEELERVAGQREPVVSQAARRLSVDCQTARRGPVPLPFAR
jgi:hypothetical protein